LNELNIMVSLIQILKHKPTQMQSTTIFEFLNVYLLKIVQAGYLNACWILLSNYSKEIIVSPNRELLLPFLKYLDLFFSHAKVDDYTKWKDSTDVYLRVFDLCILLAGKIYEGKEKVTETKIDQPNYVEFGLKNANPLSEYNQDFSEVFIFVIR
jgi:hypothetical protein